MKIDYIICLFACDKIEKYRKEIRIINETWGKQCVNNIKILYFLGEEKTDEFSGDSYINLKNVKDDYNSASYKQFLGLKYIYENYQPKFVFCCGTDTFINIPKLLLLLQDFDPNDTLYIGGHGDGRKIGNKIYYFHSGGSGFIISSESLNKLYPILHNIMDQWIQICNYNDVNNLICACDVAIAYYLQQPNINTKIIKKENFFACNYQGYMFDTPCCLGKVIIKDIVSCHFMTTENCIDFNKILLENNFFV
jgi:hypothetical protein